MYTETTAELMTNSEKWSYIWLIGNLNIRVNKICRKLGQDKYETISWLGRDTHKESTNEQRPWKQNKFIYYWAKKSIPRSFLSETERNYWQI